MNLKKTIISNGLTYQRVCECGSTMFNERKRLGNETFTCCECQSSNGHFLLKLPEKKGNL